MAFKKALALRLFNSSRFLNQTCRLSTPSSAFRIPPPPTKLAPDPDDAVTRQFLHPAKGKTILERFREMGIGQNRINFDGLIPPVVTEKLTVEDARKVLRVSQLEVIKEKIKAIDRDSVGLDEFIAVCSDCCGSRELGVEFAEMLDESGHVIVLGKSVFLRPDQEVIWKPKICFRWRR